MPITIKSTELKYKNPSTGQYQGIDAVAETTTSQQCALIEAKGAETIASIPSDYTTLSNTVSSKPNPNLLDNWYFVGGGSQAGAGKFPINSKGQTSYSGTSNAYFIDRWFHDNAAISLNSDFLRIAVNTATYASIVQPVEEHLDLRGKKICASILLANGTLLSGYVTAASTGYQNFIDNASVGLIWDASSGVLYVRCKAGTSSIDVVAVKLELGDNQTLAHQENGTWILNEIPNYQEELVNCGAITKDNLSATLFETSSSTKVTNTNDAPYGQSSYDPTTANIPSGGSNYGIIHHYYALGWHIQVALDTYGNVYKRRNINNGGWQAWKKLIDEDQVISVAKGGTGATAAWAAKANLGVPLGASCFVVQVAGTTVNVPSGSIFICFMDGGIFQLSCTNAGIVAWRVLVAGNQNFAADVSVKNKITITPSTQNAASLNWICFSDRALTLA